MKFHRRRFLIRTSLKAIASLAAALPLATQAQSSDAWPSKPIRLIVGYASGSSPDIQARMLAEPLSKALGQAVVIENKPGASGNIGADLIAKATDNHTIGIIGNGPLTSSKFLYPGLRYDPLKDFAPLALIGSAPLVWAVPKAALKGSAQDYLKQARANGDKLNYGSVGAGSGGHLAAELLKESLGINPVHVPYTGGPLIINDMVGGLIDMTLLPGSTVQPLVQSGKLAAVAVTSAERSPLTPELPSMNELGAKNVNIEVWNAVMAPAGMPAGYRTKLSAALVTILQSDSIQKTLFQQGWKVGDPSPDALAQRIKSDTALYGDLIARKHIKLE